MISASVYEENLVGFEKNPSLGDRVLLLDLDNSRGYFAIVESAFLLPITGSRAFGMDGLATWQVTLEGSDQFVHSHASCMIKSDAKVIPDGIQEVLEYLAEKAPRQYLRRLHRNGHLKIYSPNCESPVIEVFAERSWAKDWDVWVVAADQSYHEAIMVESLQDGLREVLASANKAVEIVE